MAFDIYGGTLRSGHCEVHPYVHEEYPCSVCFLENDKQKQKQKEKDEYDAYCKAEEEFHYTNMHIKHVIGLPN